MASTSQADAVPREKTADDSSNDIGEWDAPQRDIAIYGATNALANTTADNEMVPEPYSLQHPSEDVFDEIPVNDLAYQNLSDSRIPHGRFLGMFLLEYRTSEGILAYQPCSSNIDQLGIFKALRPLDRNGDLAFCTAREWSCIIQSISQIPKDVRWVLSTIYNLANEGLRPENDKNTLWGIRARLFHWYDVADELFQYYGIPATTPELDWFQTPTVAKLKEPKENEGLVVLGQSQTRSSCSSVTRGDSSLPKLVQHEPPPMVVQQRPVIEGTEPRMLTSTVHTWLYDQPGQMDSVRHEPESFDATPEGVGYERGVASSQHNQLPNSHATGSDALAVENGPRMAHTGSYERGVASSQHNQLPNSHATGSDTLAASRTPRIVHTGGCESGLASSQNSQLPNLHATGSDTLAASIAPRIAHIRGCMAKLERVSRGVEEMFERYGENYTLHR